MNSDTLKEKHHHSLDSIWSSLELIVDVLFLDLFLSQRVRFRVQWCLHIVIIFFFDFLIVLALFTLLKHELLPVSPADNNLIGEGNENA